MKILILADGNSAHTQKWINGLIGDKGIDIILWSLNKVDPLFYPEVENLKIISYGNIQGEKPLYAKTLYFRYFYDLVKIKNSYKPNIIHAHYASSYGFLGSLLNFKNYIVSIWGADVFDFPSDSVFNKWVIKHSFRKAKILLSTSEIMAEESMKYTKKSITVVPFGIDLEVFQKVENSRETFTIGTVKTLESKYGIDTLIKAFKIFKDKYPNLNTECIIVGEGRERDALVKLCNNYNLSSCVQLVGRVKYSEVPKWHNKLDVYLSLSRLDSESFGVSAIEAGACEVPAIVASVGGLPYVVKNDITGIVVEKDNPKQAAEAIEKLYLNTDLRLDLGRNARKHIKKKYDFNDNLRQMIGIYENSMKLK
jgi:L-malate glycosyltransferase